MTAIVGILNKHAVAIAADSAVTINSRSGHKVLNSANKIFSLSKHKPVGVMVYASASFMETPWELIIKMYREQLGRNSFNTLSDYYGDFLCFLRKNKFFSSDKMQHLFLLRHLDWYYNDVYKISEDECRKALNMDSVSPDQVHSQMLYTLEEHRVRFASFKKCEDWESFTFEDFKQQAQNELNLISQKYSPHTSSPDQFRNTFETSVYEYLRSNHIACDKTGIVFVGYGDEEIYPSLIPYNIAFAFDDKIRGYRETINEVHISEENKATISPFAQTDVMMTILTGISNGIKDLSVMAVSKTLNRYNEIILKALVSGGADETIINSIKAVKLAVLVKLFQREVDQFIQTEYIQKLIETVEYLDKEDLANMAESLISLTGLKRRMTSSEESVGGPVDVAVISKGDGFIWMKRKHYFNKELNSQFFNRYNE